MLGVGACAGSPAAPVSAPHGTGAASRPKILLHHGSAAERETAEQLQRLFDRYDVTPWTFTHTVDIDEDAIPHSHPVLTLHTRHLRDDALLLSTYVHEQAHWYFDQKLPDTERAIAELEALYPSLPVGFPEGATDRESSYLHLGVIFFERRGMRRLVGELLTREVMDFWATDHYRALYRLVLAEPEKIGAVLKKNGLVPPQ